ncbi:PA0069 family radical SAM protein [Herbaspirillum frisingense]|uniref:PA0069 family radical SAM protein n=1 Tax=Herbaspirillum frisingense TaxID=92645 RepID=UPI001F3B225B|nr:PA0069 family radical SAM protein [Herbaspirillum frisingense]UIN23288.1 PA0069 family radical SAM protein [Herbaspirillum frisingense]
MASFPKFPQGIARPFPDQPAPSSSDDDDATITPATFIHRQQVAQKGRGAVTNLRGRYESVNREEFDDGWQPLQFAGDGPSTGEEVVGTEQANTADPGDQDAEPPRLKTIVTEETAKSIISRNASPDLPFSLSLNPYRGCEHGCIYCFARPSHSYLGLSPGLDFESRLVAKTNAPELLLRELARPSYQPDTITVGINTDAYQPIERERQLTRRILQILHDCENPVALITKSSLIERDIDLLAAMAAKRQAIAAVTITTLDPVIARTLEPRAASPARRLRVIRTLAEAGIPVSVSIAPVIPFVTEPDLERVMEAAVEAGASQAGYIVLRLPWEVSPLFRQWLQAHFPDRAARVMNRIQDMRGGKDYDADFATRMRGTGVWAELLQQRFDKASRRLGIDHRNRAFATLDASRFRRPLLVPTARGGQGKRGKDDQLDLF